MDAYGVVGVMVLASMVGTFAGYAWLLWRVSWLQRVLEDAQRRILDIEARERELRTYLREKEATRPGGSGPPLRHVPNMGSFTDITIQTRTVGH